MTAASQPQIVVVADAVALAQTAARRLIDCVAHDNRAAVCLTGGSSPLGLYRLLAADPFRGEVPWTRVHWFMGDDRFVPESDPLSNMGAARRAFLDSVSAPRQNIHPIPTAADDPADAARRYEDEAIGVAVSAFPRTGRKAALCDGRSESGYGDVRAARDVDIPGPGVNARNAVLGGQHRQARDSRPRSCRRRSAGTPGLCARRSGLAHHSSRCAGAINEPESAFE